jgi:hypothetical protein
MPGVSSSVWVSNSPWPNSVMRAGVAGVAVFGTMHSNGALATLPGIWAGSASGLLEL